jgi:hypothetical protein
MHFVIILLKAGSDPAFFIARHVGDSIPGRSIKNSQNEILNNAQITF